MTSSEFIYANIALLILGVAFGIAYTIALEARKKKHESHSEAVR
jgi:hypothetical protein